MGSESTSTMGRRARNLVPLLAIVFAACGSESAATGVASASPRPTASPRSEEPSPTATAAAASPTGPAESPVVVESWRMTASFDPSPATSYVSDVAAWGDEFVAVGSAWGNEHIVGPEMPIVWKSEDGESWSEQPADDLGSDVHLVGVASLADARLLLVGQVPGIGANTDAPDARSVAWVSDDASVWEEVELPLRDTALVDSFDHGPKGYVLAADREVWFSADGIDWTMTYEGAALVVAGDDGFVAVKIPSAAGPSQVIASGDGLNWVVSDPIAAPLLDVAALGGDWIATGHGSDTIMIWQSANGLDWVPVLDVNDLTGPDGPKTGRGLNEAAIHGASLAGGGGWAFVTLTWNHCCAQMSGSWGVWGSTDGITWEPAVEEVAFVAAVAVGGDATVLAGHLGRGDDAAFWIGD